MNLSNLVRVRSRCSARFSCSYRLGRTTWRRNVSKVTTSAPLTQTPIEKIVRDSIKATGPISVSEYMHLCLSHPTEGYYMNQANPIFGEKGDFITSPEISQIFGELIALWHLQRWNLAGRPPCVRVIELGPGRGTLMADALRTWFQFVPMRAALNGGVVHLVETSEALKVLQEETLIRSGVFKGFDGLERFEAWSRQQEKMDEIVEWHNSLEDVMDSGPPVDRDTFTIVIAHEFFDALPVDVMEVGESGWHEILIDALPDPTAKTILTKDTLAAPAGALPRLRLVRNPKYTPVSALWGANSSRYRSLRKGSHVEVSRASVQYARSLAQIVNDPKSAGGSALIIDYGRDGISGKSLRAFKKHKIVDIFETPGECDITANVDFALLKEQMRSQGTGSKSQPLVHGPITQRDFLLKMGIDVRVQALLDAKDITDVRGKNAIERAARRLVDPTGMGKQYKVLAVTGCGAREEMFGEEDCYPFEQAVSKTD